MRAALIVLAAVMLAAPAQALAAGCDRACLIALADRTLDAMVAKSPASLPWAGTVKYSEDGVPMMVGDALWGSISARSATPLYAVDPTSGQVAWFGGVEEHGEPSFLALRLKITDGKIAEVETQLRRKGGPAPFGDPAAFRPDPAFARFEPAKTRMKRAQLIAQVNGYFDSLPRNDGKLLARFVRGCERRDNGVVTSSAGGCQAQASSGSFAAMSRVRARAFPVVDEARGVVVATGLMDYPMRKDSFRTTDGKTRPTLTKYPGSHAFIQAFKITPEGISRIETIYTPVPYLMPSPFTR